MPSYFDSLAKARAARLEREARDDSPLPIHVDPKSGLGSGLDIIPPSPAPHGGGKHGGSGDFLPRAPIAPVVDPADRPEGWRVDKGVQATPTCHTRFYFGEAEQHRPETARVPFVRAHFDVVAESEDLDFEGEHKGPNWEKYDAYAAIPYDEIVVPPGAGRVRGFFDRRDDDERGYDSEEEREARLAGVGGDATRDTRAVSSAAYLEEALRLKGIDVSEDAKKRSENTRKTGGFAWTALGPTRPRAPARSASTRPSPSRTPRSTRSSGSGTSASRPCARGAGTTARCSRNCRSRRGARASRFESPEFCDVMAREFDPAARGAHRKAGREGRGEGDADGDVGNDASRFGAKQAEKRTVEERLTETEARLAAANAEVDAFRKEAERLAAEAAEAAESDE